MANDWDLFDKSAVQVRPRVPPFTFIRCRHQDASRPSCIVPSLAELGGSCGELTLSGRDAGPCDNANLPLPINNSRNIAMSGLLGFFGAPGPVELLIVGAILLLLFGNRLPSVMRSLGQGVVEFKKGVQGIEDDSEHSIQDKQD
jgi:sec-independent protein translocase protein TatA